MMGDFGVNSYWPTSLKHKAFQYVTNLFEYLYIKTVRNPVQIRNVKYYRIQEFIFGFASIVKGPLISAH